MAEDAQGRRRFKAIFKRFRDQMADLLERVVLEDIDMEKAIAELDRHAEAATDCAESKHRQFLSAARRQILRELQDDIASAMAFLP